MAFDRSKEQDDENDLKHQLRALSQLLEQAGISSGMNENETPARQLATLHDTLETALKSRKASPPSNDSNIDTVRAERTAALDESEARFALLSETAGALLVSSNSQALVEELCRKVMRHLDRRQRQSATHAASTSQWR